MPLFAEADWISPQQAVFGTGISLLVLFGERVKMLLAKLFDKAMNRIENGKPVSPREQQAATMRLMIRSHELLRRLVDDIPSVHRVLMLEGGNGGGIPKPTRVYYIRGIGCYAMREPEKTRRMYEGPYTVDDTYFQMVLKVIEQGQTVATATELPQCVLKSLLTQEGVYQAALFWLATDEKTLTFLSVANYERAFTPDELNQINAVVLEMRGLLGTTINIPDPK